MPKITTKGRRRDILQGLGQKVSPSCSVWWPLSADDWDTQMLFFINHGYRSSPYRRGHGRSSRPAPQRQAITMPETSRR